ncbi:MAG: hemin-degrading factor [Kiritimatiellales bacterium]
MKTRNSPYNRESTDCSPSTFNSEKQGDTMKSTEQKNETALNLRKEYAGLRQSSPMLRARNAAEALGVSEGELLACRVGEGVTRLKDDPQAILKAIEPLGEVMALTRNRDCVHERKGVYHKPSFNDKHGIGLFTNPDIDLRLFMNHWKTCFAVQEESHGRMMSSIQFFDKSGTALHKIYLTQKSNADAYEQLIETFRADDQPLFIDVETYAPPRPPAADEDVDWTAFRTAWEGLKDTHDFYPLLHKYNVGRQQAFRRIGEDFAYKVDHDASRKILTLARDRDCEIMVFTGNRGCIQIHTGPVHNLLEKDGWTNVLDPAFNLHLREDAIAETWVSRKPTVDGIVTGLEVFSEDGELIVTFFGKRKPGIPELDLWRELIGEIDAEKLATPTGIEPVLPG